MQKQLSKELHEIAKMRHEKIGTVRAKALKFGVERLRKEAIIDQYLDGKIAKEDAISKVGARLVEIAEKQKKAILEDVEWGLNA